jgi:hypothetical protein
MIEPGQRFRPTEPQMFGTRAPEWEVAEVFTGSDGMPYARIRRVGSTHDVKTVSQAILRDKRRYIPA